MTLASDALAIARAGIRAAVPEKAVRQCCARTKNGLRVGKAVLRPRAGGRLHLVAVGEAAGRMADAVAGIAGGGIDGIAVTPRGYPSPRTAIRGIFGGHPVPNRSSFRAGVELLEYARATDPGDAVLFLISGGGSAAAEVPVSGLEPPEIRRTVEVLLASGVPIGPMNAIRRHLSALKGGRLAVATRARAFATIAISDVVGDVPSDIASGPTMPDPSTFADAIEVVRDYSLAARLPPTVVRYLEEGAAGAREETPKAGNPRFVGARFVLAANNRTALEGAAEGARALGYAPRILSDPLAGETQAMAREFARRLVHLGRRAGSDRTALLAGGETTVSLRQRHGRGGRNQEFSLAAAEEISGKNAVVLSVGTDGIDGSTVDAGGWTDGTTVARATRKGIDIHRALRRHATHPALLSLGRLVRTGPTGTNVMDLHIGLLRAAHDAPPKGGREGLDRPRIRSHGEP